MYKKKKQSLQSTLPLKIDGRPNGTSPLYFLRTPWDSSPPLFMSVRFSVQEKGGGGM